MSAKNHFRNHRKKRAINPVSSKIVPFAALITLILILTFCTTMNDKKATLLLDVSAPFQAKTLLPDIDMTPAGYDISGTGPEGAVFSFADAQPPVMASDLKPGYWTITANAKNAAGTVIGMGEQAITLFPGQSQSVNITMIPIEGLGSVDFTVNWTADEIAGPSVTAQLIPGAGSPIDLTFVIVTEGAAAYTADDIPTGYHTLVVQLLNGDVPAMGAVEVVRVVDGQTTYGVFEFYEINQLEGGIQVNITFVMNNPIEVTMSGQIAEFDAGEFMTVEASVPPDTGNVVYVWYINGKTLAAGSSYSTPADLEVGVYRLDVVVFTSDGSRAGSETHTFRVTENSSEPLFVIDAETGDVSGWDNLVLSEGNTFTADSAANRNGSYGFKVGLSSTAGDYCYGKKMIPGSNEVYLQFYVYIPSDSYPMINQSTERTWVIGHIEDDTGNEHLASLEMRGSSNDLQIYRLVYASNTAQWNLLYVNEVLSYDTWHSIEIYTKVGAGDAAVGLWIDGVSTVSASGFSNDNYNIESIIAGCLWSTNYTADGEYFYIDDVKADTIYID